MDCPALPFASSSKQEKKTAVLRQYVTQQMKEQAELSRLLRMVETHGAALRDEKKNLDTELQKTCDLSKSMGTATIQEANYYLPFTS